LNFFFLAALTFLLVHEMDAIRCKEWIIFPGLSRLPEETGYRIFTAAHIPLVFLVLAGLAGGQIFLPAVRVTLDVFCLAHIGLHGLCHRLPKNGFHSRFSWLIILGTGLAGLVDLILVLLWR
jgi:hypothetical protein